MVQGPRFTVKGTKRKPGLELSVYPVPCALLPFLQVFLLHLFKVLQVSLLEAEIRIQGDLSGKRSNERENIDPVRVPAVFVRFLEDQQGIVTAQ